MADDIDTTTARVFLARFGQRASEEFDRRMRRAAHYLGEIEADADAMTAFRRLVAMDSDLRAVTIGRLGSDPSGARSLGGLEDIVLFVNAAFLLEREYHAVPYVPSDELREVYDRSGFSVFRNDPARAAERLASWMAEQARFAELRHGPDAQGRSLTPAAILAYIEGNERVDAEIEERRAATRRRIKETWNRTEAAPGGEAPHGEPDGASASPAP